MTKSISQRSPSWICVIVTWRKFYQNRTSDLSIISRF